MTDRPMIFSAPMIRALLADRKTMTRRVLDPQPPVDWKPINRLVEIHRCVDGEPVEPLRKRDTLGMGWTEEDGFNGYISRVLPGDRLWVREAWQIPCLCPIQYRATATERIGHWNPADGPWRSPIHMKRSYSRLTLIVTDVRVQRLQDISDADAIAEGVGPFANSQTIDCDTESPRRVYAGIWNTLHGPDAWAQNPWVCAISFRCVKANIDYQGGA